MLTHPAALLTVTEYVPEVVTLKVADDNRSGFVIQCKKSWLQQWPQSAHLLREECIAWQKTPWELEFIEINGKTV